MLIKEPRFLRHWPNSLVFSRKKQDLISLMVMLEVSYSMLSRSVGLYKQKDSPPC
ncbi:protein of unknown function [Candidatus Nitrotoga arctica]|uniref:Uncharacterized protein n=2 Tax=Candidatus Nitrotoga arctica TaxID=453162 RepID=A0ABN8APM2_9PROT|nr:protein of unknown function [Candidatus Nitrotoga arctica]